MKRLVLASVALSVGAGQPHSQPIFRRLWPHRPALLRPTFRSRHLSTTGRGFYIGGNLGAAWNSGGSVSDTFGSTFSGSGQTTKFLGGGQVGVNYEF